MFFSKTNTYNIVFYCKIAVMQLKRPVNFLNVNFLEYKLYQLCYNCKVKSLIPFCPFY